MSVDAKPTLTPAEIDRLAGQPGLFSGVADHFRRLLRGEALGDKGQPAPPVESLPAVPEPLPFVPADTPGLQHRPDIRAPLPEGELSTLPSAAAELAAGQAATAVLPELPPELEQIISEPASEAPVPEPRPAAIADNFGGYKLDMETLGGVKTADKLQGMIVAPDGTRFSGVVRIMSDGKLKVLGGPAPAGRAEATVPVRSAPEPVPPPPSTPAEASPSQEVSSSKEGFAKLRRATLDAVLANKRGELTDDLKREGLRAAALSNSMLRELPQAEIDAFLISIGIARQQEYTLDDYQMEVNATVKMLREARTVSSKPEGEA